MKVHFNSDNLINSVNICRVTISEMVMSDGGREQYERWIL
jgi:hypothetical protein